VASGSPNANGIVGSCQALVEVLRQLDCIAPKKVPVLILGETGTGKEVFARYVHEHSPRASKPFVVVNCGAISKDLVETTLFGHEKGSFTGAIGTHIGKFEQAHGGTIFLDEFGELPLEQQVKILRVLQEGVIERVGGTKTLPVDVRVVAATNRDVRAMMAAGTFRSDLYYRVSIFEVTLPPLRARGQDDIILLAGEMLKRAIVKHSLSPMSFSEDALQAMLGYGWPGNVREMEGAVEAAAILTDGAVISADEIGRRFKHVVALRAPKSPVARRPGGDRRIARGAPSSSPRSSRSTKRASP
jgi:transcriptional regulator with GAF, ATPase, and Fis domain